MAKHNDLSEALECAVCLEILSIDNKVLPCQHTFCTQCLYAVKLSLGDQHLDFRCPECRCPDKINNLPSNIILKRVLDNLNSPKVKPPETEKDVQEDKLVRKRIRPIAESNDTEDSEDDLPVSVKISKKGRKSKPVYISEEESEISDAEVERNSSEASDSEASGIEASGIEISENEATSSNNKVSDNEASSENEATSSTEAASACEISSSDAIDSETTDALSEEELPDLDLRQQNTPEDQRTAVDGVSGSKRSLRIKEKHSRVFQKPKREDVFNAIASLPEGDESMIELRPRKLVTDFTKVNNHYNYDPDFTSGEESDIADFLDDEYEYIDEDHLVSEDSNYEPQKTVKKKPRKKGLRKIVVERDSSPEASTSSNGTEYLSEDSDNTYTDTLRGATNSGRKCQIKKKPRLQRVYRSQTSSSNDGETGNAASGHTDSGNESDIGEMSKSILERVNQRSRTMSERKRKQAGKFEELRMAREQKKNRH